MTGFFTPIPIRTRKNPEPRSPGGAGGGGRRKLPVLPDFSTLHEQECSACPLNDLKASYTKILPEGPKDPLLYVLGDHPTESDQSSGKHFTGSNGRFFRRHIPEDLEDMVRWNWVIRDRPAGGEVTPHIVECCRPSIERDIEASRPKVVVAVGAAAANWVLGGVQLKRWVGEVIPVKIRSHACWFVPIYHPTFILQKQNEKFRNDHSEEEFKRTMALVTRIVRDPSYPKPRPFDMARLNDGVTIYDSRDGWKAVDEIVAKLKAWQSVEASTDLETDRLRPYTEDAVAFHVLAISASDGNEVIAFPLYHREAKWTLDQSVTLQRAYYEFVSRRTAPLIIHNLAFELEWFVALWGRELAWLPTYEDTMSQAYVLDCRAGAKGLDDLTLKYFGFDLKKLTDLNKDRLNDYPVDVVVKYCALDVKFTWPLWFLQKRRLERLDGQLQVYRDQLTRIASATLMQYRGVPVDQKLVAEFHDESAERLAEIEKRIADNKFSKRYEEKFEHPFNPHSSKQCIEMFRDVVGMEQKGKKYSADKEALASCDVSIAKLVLELRNVEKVKSTWIDPFVMGRGESIHPDGRLHTQYRMSHVETRRTSSSDPNLQNFPKRKNASIRSVVVADPGCKLIACDYAAMEARVIAMASRDPVLVEAIKNGYDIHRAWAERIVKLSPKTFDEWENDWDKMRYAAKNKLVFPAFYGSHETSIARDLKVPEHLSSKLLREFWDLFAGVKQWQQGLLRTYEKFFFVESLTGFRRPGPLDPTQIFNTGIQGAASDFVVEAHNRLSLIALREDKPYLQPCLNVHDDLTFIIPDEKIEGALEIISLEMLRIEYGWVNVPLEIEISTGIAWGEMQKLKKVNSTEIQCRT